MNAKQLIIAAAVFAAAGSAMADQTFPYVEFSNAPSTKTRAEVAAEVRTPAVAQSEYVEFNKVPRGKTRAEVRAELQQAYASGELAAIRNTEFVEFSHVASTRTREEVRKEAIQAAKAKNVGSGS
ncbi:DUF4148 domain-containing protein [Noviherbaspirillum sp. UKPF54]|uniref:DUF4148 domain-containing protein n=1 Tax=Noviherbaspirillum sp. UKPF54 TaxID=2601898 RepID=UPI001FEF92F0|nr:DUF4148 domain-containing protein [Noviherbaspirillum sp. UKPF54]